MRKPSVRSLVETFKCSEATANKVRDLMDSIGRGRCRKTMEAIEAVFASDPGSALHFMTHGVEAISSAKRIVYYLNTGDTYGTTLLLTVRHAYPTSILIGSWGDIVERSGSEFT